MLPFSLQIASLCGVLIYFAAIFYLLKRKMLNLKYTLMWLFSGAVMAIILIFPIILKQFAVLVGITTPSNALFAAIIFFILLILMSLTSIISALNEKNKKLTQSLGLLEKRVRDLEDVKE